MIPCSCPHLKCLSSFKFSLLQVWLIVLAVKRMWGLGRHVGCLGVQPKGNGPPSWIQPIQSTWGWSDYSTGKMVSQLGPPSSINLQIYVIFECMSGQKYFISLIFMDSNFQGFCFDWLSKNSDYSSPTPKHGSTTYFWHISFFNEYMILLTA